MAAPRFAPDIHIETERERERERERESARARERERESIRNNVHHDGSWAGRGREGRERGKN